VVGSSAATRRLLVRRGRTGANYDRGVSYPRPLTEHEKAVAWTILSGAAVDELDVLREQLDAAVATDRCTCGCPSIGIAVDAALARPTTYSGRPVAEVPWKDGAIMVWIDDGWLSNLEIYGWLGVEDGDEPPDEFPDPSDLRGFWRR
jgi:hypothetical protein